MTSSSARAQDSTARAERSAEKSGVLRTVAVVVLLVLGAIAAFSANTTVWANRTVFKEEAFVATANRVLDEPAVQDRLATRLSNRLIVQGDVQQRLRERLPEGTAYLAPLLTREAQDLAYDIILRLLESEAFDSVVDASLGAVHAQFMRFVEGGTAVLIQDDQIILDLGAILRRAAEELGINADGLLANVNLPDDAGQVVLVEDASTIESAQSVLEQHNTIATVAVAVAVVLFALAVLIARNRRVALRSVGIALVLSALLVFVALYALRPVVASFAVSPEAAREAFDAFVQGLRVQSLVIILVGLAIIAGTFLAGESRLARSIRRSVKRPSSSEAAPDLGGAIKGSATALRIGGYIAGILVLAVWPEPTTRVYITTFVLLGLYLLALWVLTSDSAGAASARRMLSSSSGSLVGGHGRSNSSLVGRNAAYLRGAGIVVAALVVILVPDLALGTIAGIVALTLIYLTLVEWLAAEKSSETPA